MLTFFKKPKLHDYSHSLVKYIKDGGYSFSRIQWDSNKISLTVTKNKLPLESF